MQSKYHIIFLNYLATNNFLNNYAYFLKFKHLHSNSAYYGWNYNKLAKDCKISHALAKKKIDWFVINGWCEIRNGHLHFKSIYKLLEIYKLKGKKFKTVEIDNRCVKRIKLSLQKIVFEATLQKQQYILKIKNDLTKPTNLKTYKSALLKAKRFNVSGESSNQMCISTNKISSLFNFSISSAQKLKNLFRKNQWYEFIRNIKRFDQPLDDIGYSKAIAPYFDKRFFYFKGFLYKSMPSIVVELKPQCSLINFLKV